jgi:hypothetical protein
MECGAARSFMIADSARSARNATPAQELAMTTSACDTSRIVAGWTTKSACYDGEYSGEELEAALCASPVAQVTNVHS